VNDPNAHKCKRPWEETRAITLAYISSYADTNHRWPCIRELMVAIGYSLGRTHTIIQKLRQEGVIEETPRRQMPCVSIPGKDLSGAILVNKDASELSPVQARVLAFIEWNLKRGVVPTYRDLMAEFRWTSTNGAGHHIRSLEKSGHLDPNVFHRKKVKS
jgi:SOS-response transcriptional repressor LexA